MKKDLEKALKSIITMQKICTQFSGRLKGLEERLRALNSLAETVEIPTIIGALPEYRFGTKIDLNSDLSKIPLEAILPPRDLLVGNAAKIVYTRLCRVLMHDRRFEIKTVADLLSEDQMNKINQCYHEPDKFMENSPFPKEWRKPQLGQKIMIMLVLSCRYHGLPIKFSW